MEEQPLVTCLCLTMAGRSEFLKRAVECFARQTYPHKELLIVADSGKMRRRFSILTAWFGSAQISRFT